MKTLPIRTPSPQPHWMDYAITYITTIGLVGTGLLTYRVAANNFGELGLSQYAVMRRTIAFIQPCLALGLAVVLSRKVAARRYEASHSCETAYLIAATLLISASTLAFFGVVFVCPRLISYAFFGSSDYFWHTLSLCPMVGGTSLHIVCYAQFHGRFEMKLANTVQLVNVGIIPLAVMRWAPTLPCAFFYTGLGTALVSLIAIAVQLDSVRSALPDVRRAMRELLRIGPPRVPGDIAMAMLMMLPATLVAHSIGVKEGGWVAFSITLLTLVQTTTTPLSTMLLPQATAMLRSGNIHVLRSRVRLFLTASTIVTAASVLVYWSATHLALTVCLGNYAPQLVPISRMVMLGAIPLNIYTCLRSVVDAGHDKAINARSICCSLGLFFVALPFANYSASKLNAAPVAFIISLAVLAILTSWEVWQVLGSRSEWAQEQLPQVNRRAA